MLHFGGLEDASLPPRPLHLAIGMFDGLHRGHQSVIAAAVHAARRNDGLAGVLTFWPHPSALFRSDHPTPLLMPVTMKHRVLERLGLDFVIEQHFTRDFAAIEAADFVADLRRHLPALAALYVGENFRFGRKRAGDVALLTGEAAKLGVTVFSAPRVSQNGSPVSSSRIRELLAAGDMAGANAMLGYPYFSEGVVERGRQLGRTMGFPTLNLAWAPELKPRFGVYAVELVDAEGNVFKGVASYGTRPTVEAAGKPLLEVHLLSESALTYGHTVTVNWLHFLRPEAKFDHLETLRLQIVEDTANARRFFSKNPGNLSPNDA